ncbi:uncharacterized isomerase BH0283-like [Zingiber officinale]|uniref:uncharacterized isomerase BH0283-like n=1 Tax=Zingiber officinale TaxID=94328 RepID=UPI001C4C8A4B|nr:uncharacterized isomerase BH0283-like [Zingiber officinale]
MAKRAVRYAVIDAFTSTPFKGNPAAVCLLDAPEDAAAGDDWMQSVAKEFNAPVTAFLSRAVDVGSDGPTNGVAGPRFNIRWFTSVLEVSLFPFFLSSFLCLLVRTRGLEHPLLTRVKQYL